MDALVIVAHPDDETIWCGGVLLRRPRWDWTVLCLSRAGDADRAAKFKRVCARLGARGIISDLDDSQPAAPVEGPRDIAPRIEPHVAGRQWDLCITHGDNGEYGHLRHRQVHQEVLRLVTAGRLRCRRLWTFAVDCDSRGHCRPRDQANLRVSLSPAQLAEKRRIVRELYGFAEDSFEVRACISPEAFRTCAGPTGARGANPHESARAV